MNGNLKLSPPWINYYNELVALFGDDPDIKLYFDEESYTVKMFVDSDIKADALMKLLPQEKSFGNVVVKIEIVPANSEDESFVTLFRRAFAGNPVIDDIQTLESPIFGEVSYVVFKNGVVQYFNDDISDLYGLRSTLYQELAKDVFDYLNSERIYFCTAPKSHLD